jgi:predicted GNAT superfamily acetyltransferase
MDEITIRRLESTEDYVAAEELQQICWQSGPIEALPLHLMSTVQKEGGLVLGAFAPDGRLVGFLLGFLGREGDQLKHCSHMAATHPAYENRLIAFRMKQAQRAWMLAQGLDLCTWTFDPLESRNATLNIAKLGAVSRVYRRNIYGQMRDQLNAVLPTDRLVARWEVRGARATQCATGARVTAPVAGAALTDVRLDGLYPALAGSRSLNGESLIGIQIPHDIQTIKREAPDLALGWRMGTRALFEAAFAAGYTVVNVTPDADASTRVTRYTLALPEV